MVHSVEAARLTARAAPSSTRCSPATRPGAAPSGVAAETLSAPLVIKCQKAKQPYAIAMKDGSPFGIGGLCENWRDPTSGEWVRTFAIITTDANELVAEIHDRMPLILAPTDYARWLSEEPDPGDLMRPFPAEPMRMWPISTRVNKPENDDPSIDVP